MPTTKWLRLDEVENAIDNLDTCQFLLNRSQQPIRWKWTIITLHQALYGFAICAVQGTDCMSVLKNPNDPNSQLIGVWEAIERAKDRQYLWPGASPLITTTEEDVAIQRIINEFRNGFEHFRPAGWSIEVAGIAALVGHVTRVVRFLALESGSVRYRTKVQQSRVRRALHQLDTTIAAGVRPPNPRLQLTRP